MGPALTLAICDVSFRIRAVPHRRRCHHPAQPRRYREGPSCHKPNLSVSGFRATPISPNEIDSHEGQGHTLARTCSTAFSYFRSAHAPNPACAP